VLNKRNQILFLNLYAFSLTGGVEKVSRKFAHALGRLFEQENWAAYSMHDRTADVDSKFVSAKNYKPFSGAKISFVLSSFFKGLNSDVLILSHINLLSVAKLISLVKPKQKIILFAHGIEVWDKLSDWKTTFLQQKVQIWAVSNFTRNKMLAQHQIAPECIQVLNNCLSPFLKLPSTFEKPKDLLKKYQLNENTPVLFTLNRLSASEKYKGYDTVISALGKLKQSGQSFTYLLAGKADVAEQQRIEQLIAANDLKSNVKLIGYLPEEELAAHFLLADIFIMPSKGEGFGIVFIEAAAYGCQVIAGNIDGSTDALLNGELGQLVNPDSEAEIIEAIQKAIRNTDHHPEKQRELTLQHFGFERYVEKVNCLIAKSVN
jgi:glycosyltransferase involved in cell wall biosynthesis